MKRSEFASGSQMTTRLYRVIRSIRKGVSVMKIPGHHEISARYDLVNHSPDGFEFGYAGSGPTQLALAVLADFLEDDEKALKYHVDFRDNFIERATGHMFEIKVSHIKKFMKEIKRRQ